jgi:Cd(II)/Pb(II)-responsive transcriptional regulator
MAHYKLWGSPKVKRMRIKQLAGLSGVSIDAVRHYEKAGLLRAPARSDNGYRRYAAADVARLQFIRNCRALDMNLDEIRELVDVLDRPRADCSGVDALVAAHLGHVRERIASLRELERQLAALKGSCGEARTSEACGIVRALSSPPAAKRESSHRSLHLPHR